MTDPRTRELAARYLVDDLPIAHIPGSRLLSILDGLEHGRPVSRLAEGFLRAQGLEALQCLVAGGLSLDEFRSLARTEQQARITACGARDARDAAMHVREAKLRALQAEREARGERLRQQADAARLARERDPRYIAKVRDKALRQRYGLDRFIEPECFLPLMKMLRRIDSGQRFTEEDYVWLKTAAEEYFTEELRDAYHNAEAEHFAHEYARTADPWQAVNASSHYRKCGRTGDADALLRAIDVERLLSLKLRAALCTTHGGVMRDLQRWEEALELAGKAHGLQPDDFRPCTLFGAIYMETGHYALGQEWYDLAHELGADVKAIDQELRGIFLRLSADRQAELRAFLLRQDPDRYRWVERLENRRKHVTHPSVRDRAHDRR